MTRPRFAKGTPAPGELSRWTVRVGTWTPGVVVSKRWGQASAYWLAYPDGDPAKVILNADPREGLGVAGGRARTFLSRKEAADALLLAAAGPDRLPEAASRVRHPSGGGPR